MNENDKPVEVFSFDAEGAVDYVDRMIKTGHFHEIDQNAPGSDDIRAIGGFTFIMARTTHGEIGYSLPGVVNKIPDEIGNISQAMQIKLLRVIQEKIFDPL